MRVEGGLGASLRETQHQRRDGDTAGEGVLSGVGVHGQQQMQQQTGGGRPHTRTPSDPMPSCEAQYMPSSPRATMLMQQQQQQQQRSGEEQQQGAGYGHAGQEMGDQQQHHHQQQQQQQQQQPHEQQQLAQSCR